MIKIPLAEQTKEDLFDAELVPQCNTSGVTIYLS